MSDQAVLGREIHAAVASNVHPLCFSHPCPLMLRLFAPLSVYSGIIFRSRRTFRGHAGPKAGAAIASGAHRAGVAEIRGRGGNPRKRAAGGRGASLNGTAKKRRRRPADPKRSAKGQGLGRANAKQCQGMHNCTRTGGPTFLPPITHPSSQQGGSGGGHRPGVNPRACRGLGPGASSGTRRGWLHAGLLRVGMRRTVSDCLALPFQFIRRPLARVAR